MAAGGLLCKDNKPLVSGVGAVQGFLWGRGRSLLVAVFLALLGPSA